MKAHIRIPTNEQYAYIELETEVNGSRDAVELYNEAMGHFKPSVGVTTTTGLVSTLFNPILDRYLNGESMTSEEYESMDSSQQRVIQEIKKAFKRIKSKE